MNQAVPTPTLPTFAEAIAQVSMLARVATTSFWDRAIDKRASADLDGEKHAVTGTARVSVKLLAGADKLHNARYTLQKQAQSNLNGKSMPWSSGGWRLLPNANFDAFITEHYRILGQDKMLADAMYLDANEICRVAAENLAEFDVEPPTPERLLASYSIKEIFQEVPTGRFENAPPQAEAWLRKQFEANFKEQYQAGLMHKLAEVFEPLTKFVERVQKIEQTPEGERTPQLRDGLIRNVAEVVEQLRLSNLAHDPSIQGFIDQLILFENVHPDDMRSNTMLRQAAKSQAQVTIDRLRSTLGPMGLI